METIDLEATQPVEPVPPPNTVIPFPGDLYRNTPEMVIRHLLSQLDKVEAVAVIFRSKDSKGLLLNYSSSVTAVDMAIGGLTLTEMAKDAMNIRPAPAPQEPPRRG